MVVNDSLWANIQNSIWREGKKVNPVTPSNVSTK